jgi:hypothetical protein
LTRELSRAWGDVVVKPQTASNEALPTTTTAATTTTAPIVTLNDAERALETHGELGYDFAPWVAETWHDMRDADAASGAFYTLVPIRPRWRGGRRSLRTFAGASLRPPLAFNPRPRRLSTPTDAFQLHPDIRLYRTALRRPRESRQARTSVLDASRGGRRRRPREPRGEVTRAGRVVRRRRARIKRPIARVARRREGRGRGRGRASGAFYTLVPIRPRSRGERRSLRTFAVVSLRPPFAFNARLRRLSTPPDAFQLHPDVRLYRRERRRRCRRRWVGRWSSAGRT